MRIRCPDVELYIWLMVLKLITKPERQLGAQDVRLFFMSNYTGSHRER